MSRKKKPPAAAPPPSKKPAAAAPMSLSAYGRRRGVSVESVSKAVAARRLSASVVRVDGVPKIANADLADREWEANTRPRADQRLPPQRRGPDSDDDGDDGELPGDIPPYKVSRAIREAGEARISTARADMTELEAAQKKGELVPVAEARADVIDKFTVVKTKILGVPTRIAQKLPHLATEVMPVVDALLREALNELAIDSPRDDDDAVEA